MVSSRRTAGRRALHLPPLRSHCQADKSEETRPFQQQVQYCQILCCTKLYCALLCFVLLCPGALYVAVLNNTTTLLHCRVWLQIWRGGLQASEAATLLQLLPYVCPACPRRVRSLLSFPELRWRLFVQVDCLAGGARAPERTGGAQHLRCATGSPEHGASQYSAGQ